MRICALLICAIFLNAASAFAESAGDCVRTRLLSIPEMKVASRLGTDRPAVQATGSLPGAHGGKLVVLERTEKAWSSSYRYDPNAPAGNPFWFPLIGGSKVAAYFGFQAISDSRMTVPDADEVAGAIRKLNEALRKSGRETAGVGFYPASPDQIIPSRDFLKKFADHHELPMATQGPIAIHDLNYHLASIFVPNAYVDHAALITRRVLEFVDFAEKRGNLRPAVLDLVLGAQAKDVDGLGNLPFEIRTRLYREGRKQETARNLERGAFGSFVHRGFSPDRSLVDLIDELEIEIDEGHLKEIEHERLLDLAQDFIATHPSPDYGAPMKDYKPGDAAKIMRQIDRKRGSIAQAVADMRR